MPQSSKTRFAIIGLVLFLAGAMALHFLLRAHRPIVSSSVSDKTISAVQAQTEQLEIVSTAAPIFPNVEVSATDEELLVLARSAVSHSREGAIDWARSQSDSVLARRLLFAVVRAWGEKNANSAVDWALLQDEGERRLDMEAALAGAVKQPELALSIVRGVLKYDPDNGAECGSALVVALNNAGQFQTALEFLKEAPADSRADWTTGTFRHWGESQPQDAIKALSSIADETLRDDAFHAVVDGWSSSDPAGLAKYATATSGTLAPIGGLEALGKQRKESAEGGGPLGPSEREASESSGKGEGALEVYEDKNRAYALAKALDNWSLQDPAGMAAWLNTSPVGVNFDQAIAQLISKTDGANRSPELAMKWVENISDPKLQSDSITLVLGQWNQSDPGAAQRYLASAPWINEQNRQEILKRLQSEMPDLPGSNVE